MRSKSNEGRALKDEIGWFTMVVDPKDLPDDFGFKTIWPPKKVGEHHIQDKFVDF